MEFLLNGQPVQVADEPNADPTSARMLLWVLRDELELTGTKFGCGAGICGACAVLVDGSVTRACVTPVSLVANRQVTTIEGLAATTPTELHPVQQAFIDHQVPQCGWCMSGQIITAAGFLAANPTPSAAEIEEALSNNYCRCGCYVRIRRAVADAAERLTAQAAPASQPEVTA
jgi:isoquinoline 1-oxidoreductase alpha subunit